MFQNLRTWCHQSTMKQVHINVYYCNISEHGFRKTLRESREETKKSYYIKEKESQ